MWAQVKARFDGAHVLVEYVPRPQEAPFQTDTHRKFWRDYFTQTGAADVVFLDERPEAGL